jgi:hypothetical protein
MQLLLDAPAMPKAIGWCIKTFARMCVIFAKRLSQAVKTGGGICCFIMAIKCSEQQVMVFCLPMHSSVVYVINLQQMD